VLKILYAALNIRYIIRHQKPYRKIPERRHILRSMLFSDRWARQAGAYLRPATSSPRPELGAEGSRVEQIGGDNN